MTGLALAGAVALGACGTAGGCLQPGVPAAGLQTRPAARSRLARLGGKAHVAGRGRREAAQFMPLSETLRVPEVSGGGAGAPL